MAGATTRSLIADAANRLTSAGVSTPVVDAEILLAHVLGCGRGHVLLYRDVTDEQVRAYNDAVERRCRRHPLQHLTGVAGFRRLELAVGPGVFIPRPETEVLAEVVIRDLRERSAHDSRSLVAVDLCSGSGAVALSIATEVPGAQVTAVELDSEAFTWLERNVASHRPQVESIGSAVSAIHADAAAVVLPGAVDVVASNPPYIPEGAIPQEVEVARHEPPLALYGGRDGMDVVRIVVRRAAECLVSGGLLAVEHADVQGDGAEAGVASVMREQPEVWDRIATIRDLAGRPRVTYAYRSAAAG